MYLISTRFVERKGLYTWYGFFYCDCDYFLLIMDYTGVDDVVAVAQCEHFHLFQYNQLDAIKESQSQSEKKRTMQMSPY